MIMRRHHLLGSWHGLEVETLHVVDKKRGAAPPGAIKLFHSLTELCTDLRSQWWEHFDGHDVADAPLVDKLQCDVDSAS